MKYLLLSLVILFIFFILYSTMKFRIIYTFNDCGEGRLNISSSYLCGLFKPKLYPFDKEKEMGRNKPENIFKIKFVNKDNRFKEIIDYIWDKIVIDEIIWQTQIGFDDAFLVSIVYGIIWSFKSILINYIFLYKNVRDINIDVIPMFNENKLDITFDCIIQLRMVYIIIVWIWFLILHKGGEKNDGTSNRRVNENYNG